ncbi:MAG: hypothetical protein HY645_10395 [Acidobacteria bacterium]|nr:hypothetical protein [Acidobacteriota bacterium]
MNEPEQIPINQIRTDDIARDLISSRPEYGQYLAALAGGQNGENELEKIRALPLENRYTWRVASALRWAFVDFESMNIVVDLNTLSSEDLKRLQELVHIPVRAMQFCSYLKSLIGYEAMERMMADAVKVAKDA